MFGFTLFKFFDYTKQTMTKTIEQEQKIEIEPAIVPEKQKKDYTRLIIGIIALFGILIWSCILYISVSQNITQFLFSAILEIILIDSIFILNFFKKNKTIDYIKYGMIVLVFGVSFIF